jgi:hypothetical protein
MQMTFDYKELRKLLLAAYNHGWADFLAGDDVKSVDEKSEDKIIEEIFDSQKKDTPPDLRTLLESIMRAEDVDEWVFRSNNAFSGKRPIDVWFSEQREQIVMMVGQIEHGVFS